MRRFLVVDDSPTSRLLLKAALLREGGEGARVEEAEDGASALEAFRRGVPDLVLLDLLLPGGVSGADVLRTMLAERPDARVVLVSGHPPDHPDVAQAKALGALAYLQKPARPQAVRAVLDEVAPQSESDFRRRDSDSR